MVALLTCILAPLPDAVGHNPPLPRRDAGRLDHGAGPLHIVLHLPLALRVHADPAGHVQHAAHATVAGCVVLPASSTDGTIAIAVDSGSAVPPSCPAAIAAAAITCAWAAAAIWPRAQAIRRVLARQTLHCSSVREHLADADQRVAPPRLG